MVSLGLKMVAMDAAVGSSGSVRVEQDAGLARKQTVASHTGPKAMRSQVCIQN